MKSRHKRVAVLPQGAPSSDINITPLVDVVLVLLIIFMVVTPLLEKDISVRVPATEQVEERSEIPPDQLVVKLDPSGDLFINDQKVAWAEYVDLLKGKLERRKIGDKVVFVSADDQVNYGRLVQVLDGAKLAGAETLGMATELPPAASGTPDSPPPPAPPPPAP